MMDFAHHRASILRLAGEYGASNVRIVASGGNDVDGALDVLVDIDPGRSLFDLVDLGRELSDLLGRPVEVMAAASLNPRLREQLLAAAHAL